MKIIRVSVARAGSEYEATVLLRDEEKDYIGEAGKPTPEEAMHTALSNAIKRRTEELHSSLRVEVEVVIKAH